MSSTETWLCMHGGATDSVYSSVLFASSNGWNDHEEKKTVTGETNVREVTKGKEQFLFCLSHNGSSPAENTKMTGNTFMKVSAIIKAFIPKCNEILKKKL